MVEVAHGRAVRARAVRRGRVEHAQPVERRVGRAVRRVERVLHARAPAAARAEHDLAHRPARARCVWSEKPRVRRSAGARAAAAAAADASRAAGAATAPDIAAASAAPSGASGASHAIRARRGVVVAVEQHVVGARPARAQRRDAAAQRGRVERPTRRARGRAAGRARRRRPPRRTRRGPRARCRRGGRTRRARRAVARSSRLIEQARDARQVLLAVRRALGRPKRRPLVAVDRRERRRLGRRRDRVGDDVQRHVRALGWEATALTPPRRWSSDGVVRATLVDTITECTECTPSAVAHVAKAATAASRSSIGVDRLKTSAPAQAVSAALCGMEPDAAAYVERRRARRPTRPRADVPVRSRCLPSRFVALGCCLYLRRRAPLRAGLDATSRGAARDRCLAARLRSGAAPIALRSAGRARGANFTRAARAARSAPAGVWVRVSLRKSSELLATVQIRAADTVSQIQRRVEAAVPEGRGWFPASEQTLVRSTDRRLANGHGRDLGAIARKLGGVDVVNISHPALLRDVFDPRGARGRRFARVETTLECHCERLLPRWRHERPAMAGAQPPEFVSSGRKDFRSTVSTALSSHGLKLSAVVALDADVVADAVDRGKQKELRSDAMKEAVRNLIRLPNNLMNARIDAVRQALKSRRRCVGMAPVRRLRWRADGPRRRLRSGVARDAPRRVRPRTPRIGGPVREERFSRAFAHSLPATLGRHRRQGRRPRDRGRAGREGHKRRLGDGGSGARSRCARSTCCGPRNVSAFNTGALPSDRTFSVARWKPNEPLKDRSAGMASALVAQAAAFVARSRHKDGRRASNCLRVGRRTDEVGAEERARASSRCRSTSIGRRYGRGASSTCDGGSSSFLRPLRIWAMERLVPKISTKFMTSILRTLTTSACTSRCSRLLDAT